MLNEVIGAKRALSNLYAYEPEGEVHDEDAIARQLEEIVTAELSPYDSHPRPADRFRWARAISAGQTGGAEAASAEPAWSLFSNRATIEARMTGLIRERVQAQSGAFIPES